MSDSRRFIYIFVAFFGVLLFGTSGYFWIEGWSLLDSFFMTVITVTTVGYREVGGELSSVGKLFTTLLIFMGFGVAAYALSEFAAGILRGNLTSSIGRFRMQNEIKSMRGHFILAGFGRTGQVIAEHLLSKKATFVVIDAHNTERLVDLKIPFIEGDATEEDVLTKAGIQHANGFVVALSSDADNAFAVMSARALNSKVTIIARALDNKSAHKIQSAGANRVVAPYVLGGLRMAQAVLHPHAADFIDLVEDTRSGAIDMADLPIPHGSVLEGKTLAESPIHTLGILVIGIRKHSGEFVYQPKPETKIEQDDHLILLGPARKIETLYSSV